MSYLFKSSSIGFNWDPIKIANDSINTMKKYPIFRLIILAAIVTELEVKEISRIRKWN